MNVVGNCGKVRSHDLDRFVSTQNIARYRKLINPETSESQRRAILELLKKETVKLREWSATTA
jgi:hypothetical protein